MKAFKPIIQEKQRDTNKIKSMRNVFGLWRMIMIKTIPFFERQ